MKARMCAVAAATALAMLAVPAGAAMTVDTFLTKVTALKSRGPLALFSSDIGVLKRESAAAVKSIDAEKAARAKAGKPPLFCAPADQKKMGADEMITALQAIPPDQRGISLRDGFVHVLTRKYPCR